MIARKALGLWIPLAVALTGVFGAIYFTNQQNLRQSLNDPQIQMAEDAALIVRGGGTPPELTRQGLMVDVALSLDPWMALYDGEGKPLQYSALSHDAPPQPPLGLFDDTTWTFEKVYDFNGMKEMRVTWQDKYGVRQALVMIHVTAPQDRFVVVGRNMSVVEGRIGEMGHKLLFGYGFTSLATLVAIVFVLFLGWL